MSRTITFADTAECGVPVCRQTGAWRNGMLVCWACWPQSGQV